LVDLLHLVFYEPQRLHYSKIQPNWNTQYT
jgi:hypothetical protein